MDTTNKTLLAQMSLEEKTAAMSGSTPFWSGLADMLTGGYNRHTWDAGRLERLGIRGIQFCDGPRGIVVGRGTTFPVPMARGATWDTALEERIGQALGKEARAVGANLFGGVCINLLRHPAWGRAQETYGEDSFHVGAFGVALTKGVQAQQVMACVKHFALNSIENSRFKVNVSASARALHEVYLPHFRRAVQAGAACVMSAYNKVNGVWAGHSSELLTNVLKKRWGFKGFVVTDWIFGMRDSKQAVLGGQDLEMPFLMHNAKHLLGLVQSGEIPESRIDDAVKRMLEMQRRFPATPLEPSVLACPEHTALAREAAQKSFVLLKNEHLLPLAREQKIAVIGRLANTPNTGDGGSSNTNPPYVVTPLEGIKAQFLDVEFDTGHDLGSAQNCAKNADVAIVVVGYTKEDEGEFVSPGTTGALRDFFPTPTTPEDRQVASSIAAGMAARAAETGAFSMGGDRHSLRLRPEDEALILAISRVQPHTIVLLESGSAVLMNAWQDQVAGILLIWYPGMEGGHALADVLLGKVNPSGKLPFSIAQDTSHYPYFDSDTNEIEYDLWHGYRKLERDALEPAYPFGFGLSYSQYEYRNLILEKITDVIQISLEVHNTGARDGEEVVQIYVATHGSKVERATKELKAFKRVAVAAQKVRLVQLSIPLEDLKYFNEQLDDFVLEPLEYEFIAARHSADTQALRARLRLE
ncbi:MAG: beta-glucosidase [Deinococcales bacterium]